MPNPSQFWANTPSCLARVGAPTRRPTLARPCEPTGLPRAPVHRLAPPLEAHGPAPWGRDDRWMRGPRLADLASAAGGPPSLTDAARPALEALRDTTGESVQL